MCRNPSSIGRALNPSACCAFALDAIHVVPAMSRSVSAGHRSRMSHRSSSDDSIAVAFINVGDADFLSKMGIALREVKESRAALMKLRLGSLDHFQKTVDLGLESEATQLAAIFATIILNMKLRLEAQAKLRKKSRKL